MQDPAIKKRIIIAIVFIAIFSALGFLGYYISLPEPTCSDQKQNQAEKGIDCGGPCSPCKETVRTEDVVIKETAVALGGNGTYDAVAKITNPNNTMGARSFKYVFSLKDAGGQTIATREGVDFLLPADTKYVPELGFETENAAIPVVAEFIVSEISWEKLDKIGKPQIGVYNKNFGALAAGEGSQADGILRNESSYDLAEINVVIILRGEKSAIVGINKTKKNNVRAREERDFRLTWPYQLAAPVDGIEIDAQANVFELQNMSSSQQ